MLRLLLLLLLPLHRPVLTLIQYHLYLTDWTDGIHEDTSFQHTCLYIDAAMEIEEHPYEIIPFCLSERPSRGIAQLDNNDQKWTFSVLHERKITVEELFQWSAPMDLIERYQFYLDHIHSTDDVSSFEKQLFYNCTPPRFGSLCQYSLVYQRHDSESLNELIHQFYVDYPYEPTSLTCYMHLECDRGHASLCLDWSDICDGVVQCLNGADEKFCWLLETNQCANDQHRCQNGLCIPKTFFDDLDPYNFECLDQSDEYRRLSNIVSAFRSLPTFLYEDSFCRSSFSKRTAVQLTSSCVYQRRQLLADAMIFNQPNALSTLCWRAAACRFLPPSKHYNCRELVRNDTLTRIIDTECPEMFYLPGMPIAFGHVYLAYRKQPRSTWSSSGSSFYICYDDRLCGGFLSNGTTIQFNHTTCRHPSDFPMDYPLYSSDPWWIRYFQPIFERLQRCNTILHEDRELCHHPIMYQCWNSSKCISKYRLCDRFQDCDYGDDERCLIDGELCTIYGKELLFPCTNYDICISPRLIHDGWCDCGYNDHDLCDDEITPLERSQFHISFPAICDGYVELNPISIAGRLETDETECEYWLCSNTYTRCNAIWNCPNGLDELDCERTASLDCPPHHHTCVSTSSTQMICLPLEKVNNGNIDCFGATDEPILCQDTMALSDQAESPCIYGISGYLMFLCSTPHSDLSDQDKYICDLYHDNELSAKFNICQSAYALNRSDHVSFFCGNRFSSIKQAIIHFSLDQIAETVKPPTSIPTAPAPKSQTVADPFVSVCHRGVPVNVWFNSTNLNKTIACLCPPSFYGPVCQYQNERISLTLRFQTYSDLRRMLFLIVISLIDQSVERTIHSSQQITFASIRDCQRKFNVYLLYTTRSKQATKQYAIHIDIYEQISFIHRGSFLFPIEFPFLPITRMALELIIPPPPTPSNGCFRTRCIHGRCIQYANQPNSETFCLCQTGWSGKYCNISHQCTCSPDSHCIGILSNNRSLCVCPLDRYGDRCLLENTICQSQANIHCLNGGLCVPNNRYRTNEKFFCICPHGFTGERCEISTTTLSVSFDRRIRLPAAILVHFVQVFSHAPPENGSTYKTIPISRRSVMINWPRPFHIAFIKFPNHEHYLLVVQRDAKQSVNINRTINPSDRCPFIGEIFNETMAQLHLLRRIKYYHLACERDSKTSSCFYDEDHFCLCDDFSGQRQANCLEYDYRKQFDCFGQSSCLNDAQCLQDSQLCPTTSVCICSGCFYGTLCQFDVKSYDLSLDPILGYYIQQHLAIRNQPHVVLITMLITVLMTVAGFLNTGLSFITFKNSSARETGCGYYLFSSSIVGTFLTVIFASKYWILIMTQINYVTNRSFLYFQCVTVDFLLRVFLSVDQWLQACVAIERGVTSMKGTSFDRRKSIRLAKVVIPMLLVVLAGTSIHEPIHRRLIDEDTEDQRRIWCVVRYSRQLQLFNLFIYVLHFLVPFTINLASATLIIFITARRRPNASNHQTSRQLLLKQFQQHRHLFVSPLLLVILTLPRVIIAFTVSCMKSADQSWLYLSAYFSSFLPPMLTFAIFVLPSVHYKEVFVHAVNHYRIYLRRRLLRAAF